MLDDVLSETTKPGGTGGISADEAIFQLGRKFDVCAGDVFLHMTVHLVVDCSSPCSDGVPLAKASSFGVALDTPVGV